MLRSLLIVLVLFTSLGISQAQRLCEAIVENALAQAGRNCEEQDGELICYAYDSLSATFFDTYLDPFTPTVRVEIPVVHTLQSGALDLENDEWGIAYTQLQSNLPAATADASVRLIMLGDVLLENAVDEDLGTPLDSLLVTVTDDDTTLRTTPSEEGEAVNDVTAGMILEAVGKSADGTWIGIADVNQIVWVEAEAVTSDVDFASLPDVDESTTLSGDDGVATAFDKLYFQTGGQSECQEAPNLLVVQGPNNQSVDVTINNVPIRIGSTISIGTDSLNGENVMFVTVISGEATLYPDTPQAVTIQPLEVAYSPIGAIYGGETAPVLDYETGEPITKPDGTVYLRQIPSTDFIDPIELSEYGTLFTSLNYYDTVYLIPDSLLNYPLEKPEEVEEVVEATSAPQTNTATTPILATSTPVPTEEAVTSSCDPNELNYCFEGQPWGDGRCNDPNPDVTAYNYQMGYYNAALECGLIDEIPGTGPAVVSADFRCTYWRVWQNWISLDAYWSPIPDQRIIVYNYTISGGPGVESDSTSDGVTLSDKEHGDAVSRSFNFSIISISAFLKDASGNQLTDAVDCTKVDGP